MIRLPAAVIVLLLAWSVLALGALAAFFGIPAALAAFTLWAALILVPLFVLLTLLPVAPIIRSH